MTSGSRSDPNTGQQFAAAIFRYDISSEDEAVSASFEVAVEWKGDLNQSAEKSVELLRQLGSDLAAIP